MYLEVAITVDPWQEESAEIIIAEIEHLGFDSFLLEAPFLKAYIPADIFDENYFKKSSYLYSVSKIESKNWNAIWESEFEPVILKDKCVIKASFHKDVPKARYNIIIDPKMAFGTGHHNTTALMVEAMFSEEIKGKSVLDMGCGTGILAILAAKMGASAVDAIDIDPIAIDSVKENIKKNRVKKVITPLCGDASLLEKNDRYDIILANINRNILLEDMAVYAISLKKGGSLLISGFYEEDVEMLLNEANRHGLSLVDKESKERWSVVRLELRVDN